MYLRRERSSCFWTGLYRDEEVLPVPVAHAEGRFTTEDAGVLEELFARGAGGAAVLRRLRRRADSFPANPNGSVESIAGVCNREGNVLALMPHPERATWLRQVPEDLGDGWGKRRRAAAGSPGRLEEEGPGRRFFAALGGAKGGSR